MRRTPAEPIGRFALLFVLSLGACQDTASGEPEPLPEGIRAIDASGAQVALGEPAQRIISLVPSATQTLQALGVGDLLVGRTDYDTGAWLADVPSVGGGLDPNLEEIIALRPDLVIRFGGNQDPRTPARLDEFGITHAAVRPDRIADLYASVILLGRLTGADQAADSLVTAIEEGLAELSRNAESLPRLRAAYVLGGTPPWVAGPNTYIDEILDLLGADNVFSDLGALYTSVSREEIRARDIDVVLVSDASQFDGTLAPDARVVEIGSALEVPGPDVVRSARDVAELLRGPSGR